MPSNTLRELIEVHWDRIWDNLRPNFQVAEADKEKWQGLIPLFEQISAQNAVFIMIWNLIINRIIYTVDKRSVCGYDASLYLADNGMEFSLANMHPDSLYSVLMMNQQGSKIFTEENNHEKGKIIANLDGIYKRNTGEYFHFLQQSVCMQFDNNNNPFLFLSYVHDITYIKKNKTANLVVTMPGEVRWWNFSFDKNCLEAVQPLSKQEKKVLLHLADGKSSKEIAKKLFISSSTVDTHRRNLLKKTNCLDTTGMITYCKLVGLL